jgi:hypothetical protein
VRQITGPSYAYAEADWYAYQLPKKASTDQAKFLIVRYLGTFTPAGESTPEHVFRVTDSPSSESGIVYFCKGSCDFVKVRWCGKYYQSPDFGAGISPASLEQVSPDSSLRDTTSDILANRLKISQSSQANTAAGAFCGAGP